MAGVLQVSTPLSFETATTNVIELGHPALITISNSRNITSGIEASISQYCCGIHSSKDDSKYEPHLQQQASRGRELDIKLAQM
jgi:hypothetical protein